MEYPLLKFVLVVGLLFHISATAATQDMSVAIDVAAHPINIVDERFLSVTIDSSSIKKDFRGIDFQSDKFLTLANGLNMKQHGDAEIYLRVGGSNADDIIFVPDKKTARRESEEYTNDQVYRFNFTIFDELYRFASNRNWRVIFDLNSLVRNEDGTWNPVNAIQFMTAVCSHNYSIDYELGNEPDLYPKHRNITVSPEQLAKDFKTLKVILFDLTHGDSQLYGPDMATLERYGYFHKFLAHVDEGVLDAVTFHHYYSASTNVTVANFTSVEYLDTFLSYVQTALTIISGSITTFPTPLIRIGETSSTYGGGNPDAGESFAAGFLWLDKLGLAAQLNINVVMRQSLKGGHYSLIDKYYNPCVDYWTSVLYKQLVGTKVLWLSGFLEFNRTVRVYGHCIRKENGRSYLPKQTIVLTALNTDPINKAVVKLNGDLATKEVDGFLFTSADGKMDSKLVRLNGDILKMVDDTHLPEMNPAALSQPITLPALSYGFFVVKNSTSIYC